MSRITEAQIKQQFRDLPDGNPNYDEMWKRICAETERRRAGWTEHAAVSEPKRAVSRARRWAMAAAAAAVLAAAGGTAVYFDVFPNKEIVYTEMGQKIGISSESQGVEVTLNSVAVGPRALEQKNQMALRIHLTDSAKRGLTEVQTEQTILTDLDSGRELNRLQEYNDNVFVYDEDKGGWTLTQYFESDLSPEDGTKHYRLTFNGLKYATEQTLDSLQGEWVIDFEVEARNLFAATYDMPIQDQNQSAFEKRTGVKLEAAKVSPFEVRIPVVRDRKYAPDQAGFVYYEDIVLQTDDKKIPGTWAPNPEREEEFQPEGVDPNGPESLYFNLTDYGLDDINEKSLTLRLRGAIVVNDYPEAWTPVAAPTETPQKVQAKMPDGSVIDYKVTRKGKDVQMQTPNRKELQVVGGTKLKVDGKLYESDPAQTLSKFTQDNGFRIDVFKNVPEGKEFSVNAGTYRVQDSSRDISIPIQN
ncbi:hypothetical protein CDO73_00780 [Saccharibacillus sp. O23]|uniref:DUF4179 domain-containing protein n=1 Tax=Saccharibacillus sp. O23 TaxID=2009338 RepID=UPI000B4E473B|nr:DUF4179 domain-containing protein [Saccharibacillus sp. O23]OWR33075.1 hypothetical protein CDO73_00780 [Saccharibacillus sp. O23]